MTTIFSIYSKVLKVCVFTSGYIQIRPKKDVYKYSFFPRTIRDWNQLSDELLDIEKSVEYVFGDEGPKRCWHTQGEVGQAQGMLVSLPPLTTFNKEKNSLYHTST
jgi:hypothetical protein